MKRLFNLLLLFTVCYSVSITAADLTHTPEIDAKLK
jgi:hypothetical protein